MINKQLKVKMLQNDEHRYPSSHIQNNYTNVPAVNWKIYEFMTNLCASIRFLLPNLVQNLSAEISYDNSKPMI